MKINKRKVIIAIFVILGIVLATIFIKLWSNSKDDNETKIINEIKEYGYTLEENETALHKKYFDNLVEVLKEEDVDEEEYAKLVTMLFVSDFYNLDNKVTKNNVGGIQYVYSQAQENMVLKAKDTIYKYIESDIDNNRDQELPVVSDVEVKSVEQIEFEYANETDEEAYEVELSWTYKKDLGYQSDAVIILVHEDKKLSIAELKLTEE